MQTYNTTDTTHLLGHRDTALTAMGILDTGATGLFIMTRDAKLAGLQTMGTPNKKSAVADNTVIHASHQTRLPYTPPPLSVLEGNVVPNLHNYLIGVKPYEDDGCIRIFHPHQCGVTIHQPNDVHIKYLATPIIKRVK